MVRVELDEDMEMFTSPGPHEKTVYQLVQWADTSTAGLRI